MTTRSIDVPWLSVVQDADPDYHKEKLREVEYRFERKKFYANPAERGAYGIPAYDFSTDFSSEFLGFEAAVQTDNGFS